EPDGSPTLAPVGSEGASSLDRCREGGDVVLMDDGRTFATPAYAAQDPVSPLGPVSIERREPTPRDVRIDILFCGVCHSDLHMVRNDWGGTVYPVVPGHEIIGRVAEIGAEVTKFSPGDTVGVGCMVDSCRTCDSCKEGLQQYCENGA